MASRGFAPRTGARRSRNGTARRGGEFRELRLLSVEGRPHPRRAPRRGAPPRGRARRGSRATGAGPRARSARPSTGNFIHDVGRRTDSPGIDCKDFATATTRGVISGNMIRNAQTPSTMTHGVYLGTNTTRVLVDGNSISRHTLSPAVRDANGDNLVGATYDEENQDPIPSGL